MKNIAFFVEKLDADFITSIGGNPVDPITSEDFVKDNSDWWIEDEDLCTSISTSELSIQLQRFDTTTYLLTSQDFIGGRPPHR